MVALMPEMTVLITRNHLEEVECLSAEKEYCDHPVAQTPEEIKQQGGRRQRRLQKILKRDHDRMKRAEKLFHDAMENLKCSQS